MSKLRVRFSVEEGNKILNAVKNKLPNETNKSIFEELAKTELKNKSVGSVSSYYYGHLAKLKEINKKDLIKDKETVI